MPRRLLTVMGALFGALVFGLSMWLAPSAMAAAPPPVNPQSGAVGLQGSISSPPPAIGATISIPRNGQTFSSLPITVSGLCTGDVLVKVFKNNVFGGSAPCTNGSFSMQIDLFNGRNDLVARVYDALDQAGPDSNTVTVTFDDGKVHPGPRIALTSIYAKRGANPKQDLNWPVELSGGRGPYAISVDWGDGKSPDLISRAFPGTIDLKHQYDAPGVYNILVKATDADGEVAYLQLVGVANGAVGQDNQGDKNQGIITRRIVWWWPAALMLPLIIIAYWLGGRGAIAALKKRIARGEPAFK